MSTISNERVEFYATTKPPFGYTGSDINTMARELLALRKERKRAEPVAYIIQDADARDRGLPGFLSYDGSISDEDINEYEISLTPLYTAPPAPVVPDFECNHVWSALNRADTLECIYCGILKRDWILAKTPSTPVVPDELTWEEAPCESIEYVYGWNACRAAMLKGSDDAAS